MKIRQVPEILFRYLDYEEAFRCIRTNTLIPDYTPEIDNFTNLVLSEYFKELNPVTFELNGYLLSRHYFVEPVRIVGRPGIFFNARFSDQLFKVPAVKELNRFLERIMINVSFFNSDDCLFQINSLIRFGDRSEIPVEFV